MDTSLRVLGQDRLFGNHRGISGRASWQRRHLLGLGQYELHGMEGETWDRGCVRYDKTTDGTTVIDVTSGKVRAKIVKTAPGPAGPPLIWPANLHQPLVGLG